MSFISCKTFTPRARNKDTSSTKELIFNGSFLYDEDLSSVTIIDSKINGDLLEITVEYSKETNELLGTGGAVKNSLGMLEDEFFIMYGDSYLTCDFYSVQNCHLQYYSFLL